MLPVRSGGPGRAVPGPPDGWCRPSPTGRGRRSLGPVPTVGVPRRRRCCGPGTGSGAVSVWRFRTGPDVLRRCRCRGPGTRSGNRFPCGGRYRWRLSPGWVAGRRSAGPVPAGPGPARHRSGASAPSGGAPPVPRTNDRHPRHPAHPRRTRRPTRHRSRASDPTGGATPPRGRTTDTLGPLDVQPAHGAPEAEPATRAPAPYRISAGGRPGGPCRWSTGGCARPPGASRRRVRPPCAVRAPRAAARAAGRPAGR